MRGPNLGSERSDANRRITLYDVRPALAIGASRAVPDGNWLALPLTDGFSTNIWVLPTSGGSLRQLTDFGQRPTYIARRVTWTSDGESIVAALGLGLGLGDADVVLLRGLQPNRRYEWR